MTTVAAADLHGMFKTDGGWFMLNPPAPEKTIAYLYGLDDHREVETREEEEEYLLRGAVWGICWSPMTLAMPDLCHVAHPYLGKRVNEDEAFAHLAALRHGKEAVERWLPERR